MNHQLYFDAIAADNAFHTELVRAYGHRAGELRYSTKVHADANVQSALEAKLAADIAWLVEMRTA